jgi:hypothetical protein
LTKFIRKFTQSIALLCLVHGLLPAQIPTALWSRGYAVIPTPRSVNLEDGDVAVDSRWVVVTAGIDTQEI